MTDTKTGDSLALRCAILVIPVALTAGLLQLATPRPVAWGAATLGWMLAIYWLPSRTNVGLKKWVIVVVISTAFVVISSIVWPNWH